MRQRFSANVPTARKLVPTPTKRLRELATLFRGVRPPKQSESALSMRLAEALKWPMTPANIRHVELGETRLQIARGYVGSQPAALFATASQTNGYDPVDGAALYGYHASISWGLFADHTGATLFNSHWLRGGQWFRLPRIPWDGPANRFELLEALSPQGILSGAVERLVLRDREPDRLLRPVDDELVDRLDHWRAEALRYAVETTRIDENLQKLFAQIFVLRTVEDRLLAPEIPALQTTLISLNEVDMHALSEIISEARRDVGSELFSKNVSEDIPVHVVAGVINDTYVAHQLPEEAIRYNFAWLDADVLGLAYEKYLATVLAPAPLSSQLELFQQPARDVERIAVRPSGISVRRAAGVYYTPRFLSRYLVERCLHDRLQKADPASLPRIADFACGSGSFLVAAVDVILRHLRQTDPNGDWARELIKRRLIIGIDIDEKAITMARLNLWQRLAEEPKPLPLPDLSDVIVYGDSLGKEVWEGLPPEYDIVVGNPPFLATGRLPSREELTSRFRTARGRFDFAYLFVELAASSLAQAGRLGMVVPNRMFQEQGR